MCMMQTGGPPYGVPILPENHEKYSDVLKKAWETFDAWWKQACTEVSEDEQVSRASMPPEVQLAHDLILATPIPGYEKEGYTGADSCYMAMVNMMLAD